MKINDILNIVRETDAIFFDDILRANARLKGDSDYVTQADLRISEHLRRRLREEYPTVGFLSEEEGLSGDGTRELWVLDPIDGTANFMRGLGLCGVSLALCVGEMPILGVIYAPHTGELFWAERGGGAYLNGERISCTRRATLGESIALFEYNAYFKSERAEAMAAAERLFTSCLDLRTLGSSAISLAYIACGRADAFLGRYLKSWDWAAGEVILREAGGELAALDTDRAERHIVAASSGIFDQFLSLTGGWS